MRRFPDERICIRKRTGILLVHMVQEYYTENAITIVPLYILPKRPLGVMVNRNFVAGHLALGF